MSMSEALAAVRSVRRTDEVVITTMGAARDWQELGTHPLDFVLVPSSMGQATSVGLGLALAQPHRKVIVCNGDGSMLMNLGSLVTITAESPTNLAVLVLDNGVYEVTGGQFTAGTAGARRDQTDIDFAAVARACGFRSVYTFTELAEWTRSSREVLDAPGPTFVWLKVAYSADAGPPRFPGPAPTRAQAFRSALSSRT